MKARIMVGYMMAATLLLYIGACIYFLFFSTKSFSLKGKIDDCCTDFRDIDKINEKINPVLLNLVSTNYFRLFKVNLQNKCPFWALQEICRNPKTCGVCYCDDKDVPENWKKQDFLTRSRGKLSQSKTDLFKEQSEPSSTQNWGLGEDDSPDSVYVDLVKNVEAYTGYQGQNIWEAIYKDNCFKGPNCLEERVLNRAVSGMHSSVSTHLSEYYVDFEIDFTSPNSAMWYEKVGQHPERIQNLYFAYSILLRGLHIARDFLASSDFSTGHFYDDVKSKKHLNELIDISKRFGDVYFDESLLFRDRTKLALKTQLQGYFKNITRLMDCVECEKCRTYGKLQLTGLGTALKLIFDDETKANINLSRNEVIALINTLTKWSTSVRLVPEMFKRLHNFDHELVRLCSFLILLMIIVSKLFLQAHLSMVGKFKRRVKQKQG